MKFRNIYSHREEFKKGITFDLPSRTKQEFEDETNINSIMNRYACGIPLPVCSEPLYGDVSEIPTDYLEAQEKVMAAKEKFDSLPSEIRKRFDFNPVKMLEFIQDEKNIEEGVKLGLFRRNADSSTGDSDTLGTLRNMDIVSTN